MGAKIFDISSQTKSFLKEKLRMQIVLNTKKNPYLKPPTPPPPPKKKKILAKCS